MWNTEYLRRRWWRFMRTFVSLKHNDNSIRTIRSWIPLTYNPACTWTVKHGPNSSSHWWPGTAKYASDTNRSEGVGLQVRVLRSLWFCSQSKRHGSDRRFSIPRRWLCREEMSTVVPLGLSIIIRLGVSNERRRLKHKSSAYIISHEVSKTPGTPSLVYQPLRVSLQIRKRIWQKNTYITYGRVTLVPRYHRSSFFSLNSSPITLNLVLSSSYDLALTVELKTGPKKSAANTKYRRSANFHLGSLLLRSSLHLSIPGRWEQKNDHRRTRTCNLLIT